MPQFFLTSVIKIHGREAKDKMQKLFEFLTFEEEEMWELCNSQENQMRQFYIPDKNKLRKNVATPMH